MHPLQRLDVLVAEWINAQEENNNCSLECLEKATNEAGELRIRFLTCVYKCSDWRKVTILVRTSQSFASNISDRINMFAALHIPGKCPCPKKTRLCNTLQRHLVRFLHLLQYQFPLEFSSTQKVPRVIADTFKRDISQQSRHLRKAMQATAIPPVVGTLVFAPVHKLLNEPVLNFNQLKNAHDYILAVEQALKSEKHGKVKKIIFIMLDHNMADPELLQFASSYFSRAGSADKKIPGIQKMMEETSFHFNGQPQQNEGAAKLWQALNNRLQNHVANHKAIPVEAGKEAKIATTLSVAQLALLLRLLIDNKVITCKNQSEVFRKVVNHLSTPNATGISHESFRVKYYNIETATINGLKSLLLNLVSHLHHYR